MKSVLLQAENIRKSYQMGSQSVRALKGVNLEIKGGEIVVIAGSSGSGKTTLLNICGLIDFPDEGQLFLNGVQINFRDQKSLIEIRRQKLGFVFQNFNLIPVLTAYENVEFPLLLMKIDAATRKQMIKKALLQVNMWERRHHKPAEMSGGEQQRISLARALVKEPAVVIADEPTANLDTETTMEMVRLIQAINSQKQTTFLIASHDPLVIKSFRRVIYLRDGIIYEESAVKEKEKEFYPIAGQNIGNNNNLLCRGGND